MAWIILNQSENESRAPNFYLNSSHGKSNPLDQFRGRFNLVLVFGHSLHCKPCDSLARQFKFIQDEYVQRNAKVLWIYSQSEITKVLPNRFSDFPMMFFGPSDGVRRMYGNLIKTDNFHSFMIFILDRYGAPFVAKVQDEHDWNIHHEILEWLDFIEMQCPE